MMRRTILGPVIMCLLIIGLIVLGNGIYFAERTQRGRR